MSTTPRALHPVLLMIILGSIQAVMPISIDLYLPSLPTIAREFAVSSGSVQFTLAIFLLGVGIGQVIYGPITDKYGRKRPLIFGFGVYIIGALLCAQANTIDMLIAGRFLQALGASAGSVISSAIARDLWSGKTLADRLSILMLVLGAAPILAPSLGGVILSLWDWHGVFWVLVGYGIIMAAAITLLPETSSASERAEVQLSQAARTYADIFRNTPFLLYVLTASCSSGMLMAYITSSSFLYIEMLGATPNEFAIFFGINAIGLIGAAQLNRFALRRWSLAGIARAALLSTLSVVGLMVVCALTTTLTAPLLSGLFFLLTTSMGFLMPNIAALAFGHVRTRMGSASALQGTIQSIVGGLAGTAIGLLSNGTIFPVIVVIGGFALAGNILLRIAQRNAVAPAT